MSVKVANNRFIVPSVTDFYSKLLSRVSNVSQLGKYLAREAENAQVLRQTKKVEECGAILSCMPVQEYQLIGQYYLAWSAYRKGEDARGVLENVFEKSRTYKARSLIILAALEGRKGNSSTELRYLLDSLKIADDVAMKIKISRAMAVVKSKEGYHKTALKDLEKIAPLVRYTTVQAQYDYLNSLAVELGEVGRIREAQYVCRVVLASPLIGVYPEWRETGQDLALRGYKSRSSIRVKQIPGNILYLPEREASDTSIQTNPGSTPVVSLEDWKKKMVKDNGEDKNVDDMSDKDIFMEIMHLSSQQTITRKELQQILDAVKKITSKKD